MLFCTLVVPMHCVTACLCCQARKLEGELDVKLAAYAKLCSGFESSYRSKLDSSGLGADQVSAGCKGGELYLELHRSSGIKE